MFSKFKKKKKLSVALLAPIDGTCTALSEVPDEVFSNKMMGDGIAIDTTGNQVFAPTDGQVSFIAETKHAVGFITNDGYELLIHVGLDTVTLNGEGFSACVEAGTTVKAGTLLLTLDRALLEERGLNLITPVILLENNHLQLETATTGTQATANQTVIITCTEK
ncbi:PTS sugar transporter subunit IIA [Listeria costaricensis]|uniref:PTS sugar transporter subunit IIA n=1 Tax=Listeria costaricensis TaxID=2026604 RepID=UPI000C07F8AA|nr:PTS glucose transporter subunit IIA [Listeria costaricensis]